jgi:transposase InsO family protein
MEGARSGLSRAAFSGQAQSLGAKSSIITPTCSKWETVFHDVRKLRPYSVHFYLTTSLLHGHEAVRSQSRHGYCYDNAQAESLWSRLKTEVLEGRERPVFTDLADAQTSVAEYLDYYNHERLHSSIDYQTPYHTHQQLLQLNALNCPA